MRRRKRSARSGLKQRRKVARKPAKRVENRRLPSLWRAVQLWGSEAVCHPAPVYVPDKCCGWCGKRVSGRRTAYCCDECRKRFYDLVVWGRGTCAYGVQILRRDQFTCTECGEVHALVNRLGIRLPVSDGELEVHHILPVSMGGGHEPSNLRALCKRCHKAIHNARRREGYRA